MNKRPSKNETFLKMAKELAKRGTCARRQVGCILVDKYGHIIGSGYNGNASGLDHCIYKPCPGASHSSGSGTSLYLCEAIHAEQNALLQCKDVKEIAVCYVTLSPCIQCVKLLMQTSCERIFYAEESSHNKEAKELWHKRRSEYTLLEHDYTWDGMCINE